MQGFHCTFGIGTFVAPWIAKPFISRIGPVGDNNTATEPNTTRINSTAASIHGTISTSNGVPVLQVENTSGLNRTYLIVGAYIFVSSLFFVLIYFIDRRSTRNDPTKQGKTKNSGITTEKNSEMKSPEPIWYRCPMLVLGFFRFFFYVGLEITSASLLMTFAVKGMGWDKATGVALTACFRGVFSVGRGSSIILAIFITPTKMVILNLILINAGLGVLSVFLNYHPLILWIFISLAGFGMGSFYGASMSWADKYMNMTGKSGTLFIFGAWMGLFIIPALTGYLFDNVGPFCYIYVCLGTSILLLIVTTASMLLAHYYTSQKKHVSNQGQEMCIKTRL